MLVFYYFSLSSVLDIYRAWGILTADCLETEGDWVIDLAEKI